MFKCRTCKFFVENAVQQGPGPAQGTCHRFPPQCDNNYPNVTAATVGCGEFVVEEA